MNHYKCIKCGVGKSSNSHPMVGSCPKGDGHDWVVDDGVQRQYKCIKCGNGIAAVGHPLIGNCSKGGGHQWKV